ncbi:MAG: hypothetical protein M1821_007711 [Bathelium mastoideum]|nr:MAG: hypothetical protein M1821_007711 [Bathelium mastoideum]
MAPDPDAVSELEQAGRAQGRHVSTWTVLELAHPPLDATTTTAAATTSVSPLSPRAHNHDDYFRNAALPFFFLRPSLQEPTTPAPSSAGAASSSNRQNVRSAPFPPTTDSVPSASSPLSSPAANDLAAARVAHTAMLSSQHVYSHQQQYPQQQHSDWHPGPHHHVAQEHARAQAAAAQQQHPHAQQHAQQQHSSYGGRLGAANALNGTGGGSGAGGGGSGGGGGGGGEQHAPSPANAGGGQQEGIMTDDNKRVLEHIGQLMNAGTREAALLELSKKREQVPELALVLWHSFGRSSLDWGGINLREVEGWQRAWADLGAISVLGVMTSLLQEIISVYPLLNPSQLTAAASNRVCNALALLQCVASHTDTRALFLQAHIPLFLYPFLNTTSKSRPFEYLRLTSLGVIGALVKNDSSEVINFLLTTEIIPLCLRIMETGSELSKTVAIFIVQKILLDDVGLSYICQTYERFYAVGTVLSNMVSQLVEQQTVRLLKHVVRCFLRLSDNVRAREALRQCLPEPLRDGTFQSVLRDDAATKRCLTQLLFALSDGVADPSVSQGLLQQ